MVEDEQVWTQDENAQETYYEVQQDTLAIGSTCFDKENLTKVLANPPNSIAYILLPPIESSRTSRLTSSIVMWGHPVTLMSTSVHN